MSEQENRKGELQPKVRDQVEVIIAGFRKEGIGIEVQPANGGVGYMYATDQILVRDQDLTRVLEILGPDEVERVERVIAGVHLVHLRAPDHADEQGKPSSDEREHPSERPTVVRVLERIDEQLGAGIATPNHVLTVAPVVGPCPATEPEEVYEETEPYPGICTDNSGSGVLIYVADTGLLEDAESTHPWLHGVQRALNSDGQAQGYDALQPAEADGTTIPPYVGHGTFVASVSRCMAPSADMIVANIFRIAGSALEHHLARRLDRALDLGVDIFNLSITSPTRKSRPLLAVEAWLRLLRQYKGVICVVAAGNSGSRRPYWPAAFPEVVSVGALAADWRSRASFSNHGGWVDVYAPGRDLVGAYATGTYRCREEPYKGEHRRFFGMAKWSGTSFSTPVVTGLIAARMSRTGENGRQAAAALLAEARCQALPGVGAVLLPCCGNRECLVSRRCATRDTCACGDR